MPLFPAVFLDEGSLLNCFAEASSASRAISLMISLLVLPIIICNCCCLLADIVSPHDGYLGCYGWGLIRFLVGCSARLYWPFFEGCAQVLSLQFGIEIVGFDNGRFTCAFGSRCNHLTAAKVGSGSRWNGAGSFLRCKILRGLWFPPVWLIAGFLCAEGVWFCTSVVLMVAYMEILPADDEGSCS
ncbi:hypothetical protein Nepgr_023974 [Nepenthes gracilis]|uniref:Uncharacterized protein n=1 Tax=Nepenthes gracilis TaxID=150966 RepID=A0AAD3T5B5_NEPGR|nr:hypothetical protein Nepgr_023974 [Nepenthes gracilis]